MIDAVVVYGVAAVLTIWIGWKSDMLRDNDPPQFGTVPFADLRRPYSLAQCQMAWWFAIVIASFVYIAIHRHLDMSGILTDQCLILVGIGAGTALGATAIEQAKDSVSDTLTEFQNVLQQIAGLPAGAVAPALLSQRDALAQKLASENFLKDILTDRDGVCLHRFQSVAWTVVIGILFVWRLLAGTDYAMPELDNYTLAVLGISGGTYLGFKIPEQPA